MTALPYLHLRRLGIVLAVLVVIGLPITSRFYWPATPQHGLFRGDDLLWLTTVSSLFYAALLIPVIATITSLSLRGTRRFGLLEWDRARPLKSVLVTFGFVLPLLVIVVLITKQATAPPEWKTMWWLPYELVVMLWLAIMRSAALALRNARAPMQTNGASEAAGS